MYRLFERAVYLCSKCGERSTFVSSKPITFLDTPKCAKCGSEDTRIKEIGSSDVPIPIEETKKDLLDYYKSKNAMSSEVQAQAYIDEMIRSKYFRRIGCLGR